MKLASLPGRGLLQLVPHGAVPVRGATSCRPASTGSDIAVHHSQLAIPFVPGGCGAERGVRLIRQLTPVERVPGRGGGYQHARRCTSMCVFGGNGAYE